MATLEERLEQAQSVDVESLEQRLAKAQLLDSDSGATQFGLSIGRSLINNLLSLPGMAASGLNTLSNKTMPGRELPEELRDTLKPAEEFFKHPAFSTQGIEAARKSLPEFLPQRPVDEPGVENPVPPFTERFPARFDEELARINAEEARLEDKFGFQTGAGNIGGNVLSIMVGRFPFLSKIENAEAWLAGKKFADAIKNPGKLGELGNIVKKFVDSKGMRSLLRGTGRAGEAGLEAASIEALTGDDPLRTAAYVVGGQAVGSAMLAASKGLVTGGPLKAGAKLTLTAGAYLGLIQTFKEGIPGGENDPMESFTQSFNHIMLLLAAGGVAVAAGTGRIRRTEATTYPRSAEFLSTLPRAHMISLVSNWVEATPDEQQTIEATLQQLQEDPEFFGPEITEKLQEALDNGNLTEALRQEF